MDLPLFQSANHAEAGRVLRDAGMSIAASNCNDWLQQARQIALMLAAKHGEVTIDQVKKIAGEPDRPNAAGSVFKDKRFRFTGRYTQTTRLSGHARDVKIWELA